MELAPAVLRGEPLPRGLDWFKRLLKNCTSLTDIGGAMLWVMANRSHLCEVGQYSGALEFVLTGAGKALSAVHQGAKRKAGSLFPLPLGEVAYLMKEAEMESFDDFTGRVADLSRASGIWTALSVLALNGVAGFARAAGEVPGTSVQRRALSCLQNSVKRTLCRDFSMDRSPESAEKELSSRHLTYSGEVVPAMQVIGIKQVEAALPPLSHAGSIDALKFVSEGTQKYLSFPEDSLLPDVPAGTRLQSKVHITKGEELELAKLLVDRHICTWVPLDDILVVNNTKVLNGLFAVGKGNFLDSGCEVQRLIMNLVPSNAVFRQLQGAIQRTSPPSHNI